MSVNCSKVQTAPLSHSMFDKVKTSVFLIWYKTVPAHVHVEQVHFYIQVICLFPWLKLLKL